MKKSKFLVRGIKWLLVLLALLLAFVILPVILRYILESIIVIFGIQMYQYSFLLILSLVIIYHIYLFYKNDKSDVSNTFLTRMIRDWKTMIGFLILGSWIFYILGFSFSAYWLKEFNFWIGVKLTVIIIYIGLRISFQKFTTGEIQKLSKIHQVSFLSTLILFVIIIYPYFQVTSIRPHVSSEEFLEFNTNSDLVPLQTPFSLNVYLNGYSYDSSILRIQKNIQYNNFSSLDVYYIPNENNPNPILIVIHGGGWISGSKSDIPIKSVSQFFAFHGFTVFAINYRLYPEVRFTGMLHDVRDAIVFAKENAEHYSGDKDNIFLFGRSSGAQLSLVAAYGTNVTYFNENCGNYTYSELKVRGVASIYGISKISQMSSRILGVTSNEDSFLYDLASPVSYINRSGMVPTFIAAGSLDALVSVRNSRDLQHALNSTHNEYMYLEIPWANHSFDGLISGLSSQLSLYYFLTFFSHFT